MAATKFYNIEGIIRNGFKLSHDYEILDFTFTKLGNPGVAALCVSSTTRRHLPAPRAARRPQRAITQLVVLRRAQDTAAWKCSAGHH